MGIKATKRCKKCIISKDYPGINFDDEGICNLCSNYIDKTPKPLGSEKLYEALKKYRGVGDYDCLVGFSGGKDSTYVLYLLKKKYDLKILALTGEDYLASPQAWRNRHHVTKILDIEHQIVSYDWDLFREVYRYTILKSGMRPRAINLVHNLMHERAIYETLQNFNIPLFITGNTENELMILGVQRLIWKDLDSIHTFFKSCMGKKNTQHKLVN